MKKVRIMLFTITAMAIASCILAFKAKQFSQYCLYQVTVTVTQQGGPPQRICRTLGQFDTTYYPAGVVLWSVYLTENDCVALATTTETVFCNNIKTVTIQE